jgi:hypothetical protein
MSQDFLTRLFRSEKKRQQTVKEKWDGLVRTVADGQEPAAGVAEQILDSANKTAEDLRAAVERLILRRQARAAYDKAKDVPAETEKTHRLIYEASAAYENAVQKAKDDFNATHAPLVERLRQLDALAKQAIEGQRVLQDTAEPRPELEAQIEDLVAQQDAVRKRQGEAAHAAHKEMREAGECRNKADMDQQGARTDWRLAQALRERADLLEKAEQAHRAEAAAAGDEIEKLQQRIDALQSRRLDP